MRLDDRGPWKDLLGVFSPTVAELPPRGPAPTATPPPPPGPPELEVTRGSVPYRAGARDGCTGSALRSTYLEIGVRGGASLRLAAGDAVAVDPAPHLRRPRPGVRLFTTTSDHFFEDEATDALAAGVDLAFIDGLHLFENVLRDFMHVERYASPSTVVLVDDVLPAHPVQGRRERETAVWRGDVWKITDVLRRHRPDLTLTLLDSSPSGMLLVTGLDPDDRVLWDLYNRLVRDLVGGRQRTVPARVLERRGAVHPDEQALRALLPTGA